MTRYPLLTLGQRYLPELDHGGVLRRILAHLLQFLKLHGHRDRDLPGVAPVEILDLLQPKIVICSSTIVLYLPTVPYL